MSGFGVYHELKDLDAAVPSAIANHDAATALLGVTPDCAVFTAHDARSQAWRTPSQASEGGTNRKRGDRCQSGSNRSRPTIRAAKRDSRNASAG